jgi:hypothetical protein
MACFGRFRLRSVSYGGQVAPRNDVALISARSPQGELASIMNVRQYRGVKEPDLAHGHRRPRHRWQVWIGLRLSRGFRLWFGLPRHVRCSGLRQRGSCCGLRGRKWRPRRCQRFASFHDVDGKHFRGLVPYVHSAADTEI